MFSTGTVAALAVGGLLACAIPIIAIILFKLKNREVWLPGMLIGAGTFIVFAMILESILRAVMLPVVKDSIIAYSVYGALAAGIFEETGRFVVYKTLMRKHYSTKNAVMTGLGHGGCEAVILLGITLLTYFAMALAVNTVGLDAVLNQSAGASDEVIEAAKAQLESISQYNFASMAMGIYERIVAMTFHVCMSVFVYKSVTKKGKIWLFPTAIFLHAALDFPAAMFQAGAITSLLAVYAIMTVLTALVVISTVIICKRLRD